MSTTLAAWLHDWSPFLVKFTDSFGVRWYGLAYAVGFLAGWAWLRWMSTRGLTPLSHNRISDAMLALVVGVVVGGRLGYVIFYEPSLITRFVSDPPWWGVLQINHGGMASHGGMIGVIAATWYIGRGKRDASGQVQQRVPWLHVIDLTALACTPGLMLGRLANFINGELLGAVVAAPGQPAPWWSVKYPQEVTSGHAPLLTADQQAHLDALVDRYRLPGQGFDAAYDHMVRVLQSGPAQDRAAIAQQLEPLISARYPSQLLQATAEGLVLGIVLWIIWRRPRYSGVLGAWFFIVYGVMRIATEFVRLPDPQSHTKALTGLSTGQWLSVGMIAVGAVALPIIHKRNGQRFGGWGTASSVEGASR